MGISYSRFEVKCAFAVNWFLDSSLFLHVSIILFSELYLNFSYSVFISLIV